MGTSCEILNVYKIDNIQAPSEIVYFNSIYCSGFSTYCYIRHIGIVM